MSRAYHKALDDKKREESLKEFNRSPSREPIEEEILLEDRKPDISTWTPQSSSSPPPPSSSSFSSRRRSLPLYLVTTDRLSRGIDVLLADHIVLFDFPR